jgi:hypothetical protein
LMSFEQNHDRKYGLISRSFGQNFSLNDHNSN